MSVAGCRVEPAVDRLAATFSPRVFKAISSADVGPILLRLAPLADLAESEETTLGEAFDSALDVLRRGYRSEYVYKNELVSKLVFGKHSPATASALLEQPMGRSCADVLIVNGTTTTYEIKTDLDDFSRLDQQLADYGTRSEFVNVVVSETRSGIAERHLAPGVGLLAVTSRGNISVKRRASSNLGRLEPDHIFQLLRIDEALTVLKNILDYDLDVPRGHAWTRARQIFLNLDIEVSHPHVIAALRSRGRSAAQLTTTECFPTSLRALAYGSDLSGAAQGRFLARIDAPLHALGAA